MSDCCIVHIYLCGSLSLFKRKILLILLKKQPNKTTAFTKSSKKVHICKYRKLALPHKHWSGKPKESLNLTVASEYLLINRTINTQLSPEKVLYKCNMPACTNTGLIHAQQHFKLLLPTTVDGEPFFFFGKLCYLDDVHTDLYSSGRQQEGSGERIKRYIRLETKSYPKAVYKRVSTALMSLIYHRTQK